MRSLRALTWLLVLLVLVPAGVLAWLGYRSAGALDEALDAGIRADLTEAEAAIRRAGEEEARALEAELRSRLEPLAATLAREAPARGLAAAMVRLCANLPDEVRVWDVLLLDADGHPLWPASREPDVPASSDSVDRLLFDLRQEADRLRVGEGDPDAAVSLWRDAAARARSRRLTAVARAEGALLEARLGRVDAAAAHAALLREFDASQREAAARPLLLLLAWAAERKDREAACELSEAWARGEVAAVPLLDVERSAIKAFMSCARVEGNVPPPIPPGLGDPRAYTPWSQEALPPAPPRLEVEVPGGARLVATCDPSSLWEVMRARLERRPWAPIEVTVLPWADQDKSMETSAAEHGVPHVRLAGPLATPGVVLYRHRDAEAAREDRTARRRVTVVGVVGLLVLTVIGLALVRRAVVRERDATRLRDDFIANVSHELRTPLTSVCLHAEMLAEEDPPPERRREMARVVRAEGGRLAALVDDLLDFAALERGVRRIEPEPVDLAAAVREAAAPYETLAAREGVDLAVEVEAEEVVALADAHALGRILANLLSNAWRHGRPSQDGAPGRIRIRAADDSFLGPLVEVVDDGPGIQASERGAVFERFRRGRGSARVEGTGLGLALGRELARAMDGELELVEDADGTVFRLTLPPASDLEA